MRTGQGTASPRVLTSWVLRHSLPAGPDCGDGWMARVVGMAGWLDGGLSCHKGSPVRRASNDLCGLHCFEARRVVIHCGCQCCHGSMPCDRHSAHWRPGRHLAARSRSADRPASRALTRRLSAIPDGQRGPSRRRTHRHAGPSRHGWLDGHRSALHGRTPRRLGPPGRGPLRAVGLRPGRL